MAAGSRLGVVRPLAIRDFRLLWIGMTVSMVGDGIYVVAMALQVLEISNSPSALAMVGLAWSAPQVGLVLASGALSDRLDRRKLMITGDLIRLGTITAIGVLSIAGELTMPLLIGLVAVFGAGQAIFQPAFSSILPTIVPEDMLVEANSLSQIVRPASMLFLGPIIGGVLSGLIGVGGAFVVDGVTFAWSAVMILLIRTRHISSDGVSSGLWAEIAEGVRYVRGETWISAALVAGTVSLLCVWGPWEVLVPYVVTNDLRGDEYALGLVFGAGGLGSVIVGLTMGQRGTLPRRPLTIMYVAWAVGMLMTAGFGLATTIWQAMVFGFIAEGSIALLIVLWYTMLQRLVPRHLLGRVISLDWMISIAGVPLSFGIVGPVAGAIGADATLIGAGVLGATITIAFMFVTGAREPERDGRLAEPEPDPEPVVERSPTPT
ncbi:MAG TPA: MFS transporter [Actinomycetota bacterium]|nr:MFS transporter [Actinomycetota bacterium]